MLQVTNLLLPTATGKVIRELGKNAPITCNLPTLISLLCNSKIDPLPKIGKYSGGSTSEIGPTCLRRLCVPPLPSYGYMGDLFTERSYSARDNLDRIG